MLKPISNVVQLNRFDHKKENIKIKPVAPVAEINPYKSKHSDFSRNIITKGLKIDKRV